MKIAVLIVTFNRLEKLKKSIDSYIKQSKKPYMILVVDNCSTDGTSNFLDAWVNEKEECKKKVIHLDKNIGGSGGFYEGMKYMKNQDYDWLWISDDDAYPKSNSFELIEKQIRMKNDIDVICSSVYTSEGIDLGHRKVLKSNKNPFGTPLDEESYLKDYFEINIFTFVGVCFKKEVIDFCGLPEKDYFIWFDDTEYSLRVNRNFKIICVPSIIVFHDTVIEKEWKYSWKTYYGERNKLFTLKKHLSESEFKRYLFRYKLGMIKHYFSDHKYYLSQKDGYNDFKEGILGIPYDHLPGKYKYR